VSLYGSFQKNYLAALDLASIHQTLGSELGVFFYKCYKWFAHLFNSHGDQLHLRTVILKTLRW